MMEALYLELRADKPDSKVSYCYCYHYCYCLLNSELRSQIQRFVVVIVIVFATAIVIVIVSWTLSWQARFKGLFLLLPLLLLLSLELRAGQPDSKVWNCLEYYDFNCEYVTSLFWILWLQICITKTLWNIVCQTWCSHI